MKVIRGIGELITLSGVAKKKGRHPKLEDLGLIERACIVEKNGAIEWCGREVDLPKEFVGWSSVDLKGATVIPAFVDAHTHLIFAGSRSAEFELRNQGVSYLEIAKQGGGILSTLQATRQASQETLAQIAQQRVDRHLRQGVTTIEVKSGYGLNFESEVKMLKAAGELQTARIVRTYLGAHAVPKEFGSAEAYIENILQNDFSKLKAEGIFCRVDIFVENGFFPRPLAEKYLRAVQAQGFELVLHADQLTRSGGAELAVQLGARSADHLVQINSGDVELLSRSNVVCVLLPGADLYMNCAYPPARALIDAGAIVALATDYNPGSCPSLDLGLMGVLARVQMKMSLVEVIAAFTFNGAAALGLEKQLGSLEAGKLCDFAVLSSDWRDLFYDIGQMPITQTWKEGQSVFSLGH